MRPHVCYSAGTVQPRVSSALSLATFTRRGLSSHLYFAGSKSFSGNKLLPAHALLSTLNTTDIHVTFADLKTRAIVQKLTFCYNNGVRIFRARQIEEYYEQSVQIIASSQSSVGLSIKSLRVVKVVQHISECVNYKKCTVLQIVCTTLIKR